MDAAVLVPWLVTLVVTVTAGTILLRRHLPQGNTNAAALPDRPLYAHYAKVLENCDDVAWLVDIASQRMIFITPSVERLRGWKVEELLEDPMEQGISPVDMVKIRELIEELKRRRTQGGTDLPVARLELEVLLKQGGTMPVETECKLINDDYGRPNLLLGISRDITERRRLEQTLREGEERVRLALYCSGDGVWDGNLQTGAMTYLDGWEEVLGYKAGELQPNIEGYFELVHPDDRARLHAENQRHLNGEAPAFQCEFRMRTRDGGWRWVLSRGLLWSRTTDGKPLRMIGTHTDITSRKVAEVAMSRANVKLHTQIDEISALQSQLAEQAVRDPLTGLYNRRYLDETMEREVARARREGHPLSVVMLDVDHFKKLNDSYGHQAGDEVLKALAELLREETRAEDVACRYGGEEFLVLLPSMPLDKARERAEHWRGQLEKRVFVFGNFSLSATASFGVSGYPYDGKTPDELARAADSALYSAKRNGRNRVEMFGEAPIVFVTGDSATGI